MIVTLDLFRTTQDGKEWVGSFMDLEGAIAELREKAASESGHYVIYDQRSGEVIFAEQVNRPRAA